MMRWLSTAERTGTSSNRARAAAASRPIAVLAILRLTTKAPKAFLELPGLADQLHRVRGGPNVVRRRLDGNQHEVAGQDRGSSELVHARRAVDDRDVVVCGELGKIAMKARFRHADDREQRFDFPRAGPSHRAALGIGVDQKNAQAGFGQRRRQIDGEGRLADASFLIQNADNHQETIPGNSHLDPSLFLDCDVLIPNRFGQGRGAGRVTALAQVLERNG